MRIEITTEQAKLLRGIQLHLETIDGTTEQEDETFGLLIDQIDRATPNPNQRKVTYKCKHCVENGDAEESSIYWDASTYWDDESQSFEASDDPNGESFCGHCGSEGSGQPFDIETGEELRERIYGSDGPRYVTVEEYNSALDAARSRYAKEREQIEAESRAIETANLLSSDLEVTK